MTVTSGAKLNKAYRFMPSEEKTDTRDVLVINNNLYFGGDRAWFVIENFMKSDVDFRIRIDDMRTIVSMKGEIEANVVDQYSVRFSNGTQSMVFYCNMTSVSPPPSAVPLLDTDYEELPELIKRIKGFESLIDENCTAGIVTHIDQAGDEHGYLVVLKDTVLVAMKGEPGMNIDLTSHPEILTEIMAGQTRAKIEKKMISTLFEGDGFKIFSQVQHSANRFADKVKAFTHGVAGGNLETAVPGNPLTCISVKATTFLDALAPVNKMKHEGFIKVDVANGKMKLAVADTIKNTYTTEIDCVNDSSISFETNLITGEMVTFLMNAVKTTPADAMLDLIVNPWKLKMVMRMTPNADQVNAFCMLKILI